MLTADLAAKSVTIAHRFGSGAVTPPQRRTMSVFQNQNFRTPKVLGEYELICFVRFENQAAGKPLPKRYVQHDRPAIRRSNLLKS
jgi:hypothetical protein